jgi:hypothetical protein
MTVMQLKKSYNTTNFKANIRVFNGTRRHKFIKTAYCFSE